MINFEKHLCLEISLKSYISKRYQKSRGFLCIFNFLCINVSVLKMIRIPITTALSSPRHTIPCCLISQTALRLVSDKIGQSLSP